MQLSSKARKAAAIGLTASTLLWASVGLIPTIASAATHTEGCLVLSGGIVWMITGGTRRGFTSAEVFQSWGYNFSQVVTATAEDVALPVGPIMVYADGTLVMGPGDPLVYLVSAGQKRGFTTGAVFSGLGFSFANIQVAPANTFADLPVGANLDNASIAHPAGVQVISNGAVWWMDNNGRRGFSSGAQFQAYGYKFSHVVAANAADLASPNLGDVPDRPGCSTSGTPTPVSGAFSVSLASDTPAAGSVVADSTNGGQALASLAKFNFVGGSSGATVTTVVLHRVGVANDSSFSNAYLYDGTTRLATVQSISLGVLTFTNSAGLFTVSPNTVRAITVKIDVAKTATAGQTLGVSISAAADVTATGSVHPSGTFPLSGNTMTVATVTDLGKLTVANVTDPGTSITAQTNVEVWRLSVQASNQNLTVSKLAFTNLGSTTVNDMANFTLWDGGTQVGTAVAAADANRMVTFTFSLSLTSGVTKQLSLHADLVAGATRTFQFSIQNSSDIEVMDNQYGVALFPFPSGGTVGTWTVVKATNTTTISAGTLSVSKTSDSTSGAVALNATNVTLAKFEFKANGENVKVSSLNARMLDSAGVGGDTKTIKNLKLLANGVQVGTTQTTVTNAAAQNMSSATADANDVSFTLGNSLVVAAGTSVYVTLVADLTGTITNTMTVQVGLVQGSTNAQGITSLTSINAPGSTTGGNAVTVSTAGLTGAKSPSLANVSTVKGATGVTIASFNLTAAAEAIDLNSVVIKAYDVTNDAAADYGLGSAFNNIKLMYGSTQLGSTQVNPSTTATATTSFSVSPAVTIASGASVQINVVADILSGATWTSTDGISVTTATAGVGKSTSTTVSLTSQANGQTITLNAAGTLTVTLDGSTPAAQQIVMGSSDNTVAAWKFEANNNEDLAVSQIIVADTGSTGGDVQNLKLFVDGVQVGSTVPSLSAASTGTATFGSTSGTLFTVTSGSYKVVTLKVSGTSQSNATGAAAVTFKITPDATITGAASNQVIARGAASGAYALVATASQATAFTANAAYAYRTKLTAALNSASPSGTGKTRQANDTIFKMDLTANSAYQAQFRAGILNNMDATTDDFAGATTTAGTWAVVTVGDDGSTMAADSSVKIQGTGSMLFTQGATTPVAANGLAYTMTAKDLSAFNGMAFWVKASNATPNLTLTLTGAGAGSQTVNPATTDWEFMVVPFSGATTPFTGLTAITAISLVSASAYTAADTVNVDAFYFYKDFIKANVAISASGVDDTLVTAKDTSTGTTFATGYTDGSATAQTVYFIPTADFNISAGATRTLSLLADTTALLAASTSVSVNVNLGSSSSTVASPGDIVWYDGKVSTSVPWVDSNPNPVQGGSLAY